MSLNTVEKKFPNRIKFEIAVPVRVLQLTNVSKPFSLNVSVLAHCYIKAPLVVKKKIPGRLNGYIEGGFGECFG
jgi:hypothetical protein